jgi:hypothetical protein
MTTMGNAQTREIKAAVVRKKADRFRSKPSRWMSLVPTRC